MNSTDVITVENTLPMGQSTVTTEYNEVFDSFPGRYSPYTPLQAIFLIMVLSTIILATVIGNVLVCVAVFLVKRLRKPWNYLLVSLAVSDLCVALLVMPTALIYEISGEWPYGPAMCDFWVSLDVLSCTASILNLCMIAVDRFFAITKPLQYETKRTPRRMVLYISLVWFGAACISLPPLLVMGNEYTDPQDGPTHCTICQNFFYQIFATLGSFYLPLGVMIQVYYKIFCAARRLVVEEQRSQVHTPYQPREDFDDESGPSFLSRSVIPNVELEDSPVEQQSEKASMTVQFIRGTDDADEASEVSYFLNINLPHTNSHKSASKYSDNLSKSRCPSELFIRCKGINLTREK
ncbi:5-hydroxytryptamine receptor 1-like [Bombus affinis]|uniref:5-hydroxytryptamine receptor 1-like n=1 Tax=Bombus affinis TaxID=309941 RepID=UPI0021B81C15|nr:5-hydroxytryptamine receptor 1-like [Bombus affinis]